MRIIHDFFCILIYVLSVVFFASSICETLVFVMYIFVFQSIVFICFDQTNIFISDFTSLLIDKRLFIFGSIKRAALTSSW